MLRGKVFNPHKFVYFSCIQMKNSTRLQWYSCARYKAPGPLVLINVLVNIREFIEATFKYTNYKLNRLFDLRVMQGTIFRQGNHISSYFTKMVYNVLQQSYFISISLKFLHKYLFEFHWHKASVFMKMTNLQEIKNIWWNMVIWQSMVLWSIWNRQLHGKSFRENNYVLV